MDTYQILTIGILIFGSVVLFGYYYYLNNFPRFLTYDYILLHVLSILGVVVLLQSQAEAWRLQNVIYLLSVAFILYFNSLFVISQRPLNASTYLFAHFLSGLAIVALIKSNNILPSLVITAVFAVLFVIQKLIERTSVLIEQMDYLLLKFILVTLFAVVYLFLIVELILTAPEVMLLALIFGNIVFDYLYLYKDSFRRRKRVKNLTQ